MLRLINSGCNGYMGRVVTAIAKADPEVEIIAGIDINAQQTADYPVYESLADLSANASTETTNAANANTETTNAANASTETTNAADVIIDFSTPSALEGLLKYGLQSKTPLILCTTGYSAEQIADIEKASTHIPIFRSGNMSVGINLLADLIRRASAVLGDSFDIEIVERHHRRKVDAPSGTALLLADAASGALPYKPNYIYERESVRKPRGASEIGISAVRGGTIVGVHDVIFAGQDEVIELRHTAASREIFAVGALRAAKFIAQKPPGLYDMKDVISEK